MHKDAYRIKTVVDKSVNQYIISKDTKDKVKRHSKTSNDKTATLNFSQTIEKAKSS